jgi:hypothetical protein
MPEPEGPFTHFAFLAAEWPEVLDAARRAERLVYADARASSFYARRALELAGAWMYRNDRALALPYQDHLSALFGADPKTERMLLDAMAQCERGDTVPINELLDDLRNRE